MERLDKLLSLHNICSRRQAAALTRAGQVRLNGVAVRRADHPRGHAATPWR